MQTWGGCTAAPPHPPDLNTEEEPGITERVPQEKCAHASPPSPPGRNWSDWERSRCLPRRSPFRPQRWMFFGQRGRELGSGTPWGRTASSLTPPCEGEQRCPNPRREAAPRSAVPSRTHARTYLGKTQRHAAAAGATNRVRGPAPPPRV